MKLLHVVMALFVLLFCGLVLNEWYIGAGIAAGFFLGREFAQAEYRWIEAYGGGLRANMSWYSIWTTKSIWSEKSWLWDMVLPIVIVVVVLVFREPLFRGFNVIDTARSIELCQPGNAVPFWKEWFCSDGL